MATKMWKFGLSLFFFSFNILNVSAMVSSGRNGHGLIGYGIEMYKPICAFACRSVISASMLDCSTMEDGMAGMAGMDMGGAFETSPECYTTDDSFLQTLAWCISTHCTGIAPWKLEKYWTMNVAGNSKVQPDPKATYQETLTNISSKPTEVLVSGDPLNKTSIVSEDDYIINVNGMSSFEGAEDTHERYGLVLLLSGSVIPIGFSLLRFIPWPANLVSTFNAVFIYPPAIGSKHNQAIFGFAHVPTRGQAFFIFYLIAINIILSSVGYHSVQPNSWFETTHSEVLTYVTNRVGVLSFANLPLLILYAGRNNILLTLTNWSHSTFLLLHRWVAWICTLQAVLHSIIYLRIYLLNGSHSSESKVPYWIWGAIATIAMSVLLPSSMYPIRKKFYEAFLLWHIALSVLTVAGCYLHILYRFQHQWGYEVWTFVAMAVWGFDRVMRVAKLARNGVRKAVVTVIDSDYIRVDIDGVVGDGHAYLYFPTLTWKVWENHPFSVVATPIDRAERQEKDDAASGSDVEKHPKTGVQPVSSQAGSREHSAPISKVGMSFLVRVQTGMTAKLAASTSLPVLVESPYCSHTSTSEYSHLICVVGGVGITAVLPYLRAHPGRKTLLWGVRTTGIVEEMKESLVGVDKEVFVGARMNVREVLDREISGAKGKTVVVVSGPEGLADEVRVAVSALGKKKGAAVSLVEEAFSW